MAEMQKQEELETQQNLNNNNNNNNNNNYNNNNNNYNVNFQTPKKQNSSKPKKSGAEKAFQKATNSAITSFGRKLGNEIFKKLFK